MKNIKLYALVGAVMLISLLALSGAWAGSNYPATVPAGFDATKVEDIDCDTLGQPTFGNNEYITCAQVDGNKDTPVKVCFPKPNKIYETTGIFYWDTFTSQWVQFPTIENETNPVVHVTNLWRCVTVESNLTISFQGMPVK